MKMINLIKLCIGIIFILNVTSCKKYLEEKSDSSLTTPQTLDDIEALVDTYSRLNVSVAHTNESADEYYLSSETWNGLSNPYKGLYIWDNVETDAEWNRQYLAVLYANTILDNLEEIAADNQQQKWNQFRGAALFFRAQNFYQLAQLYAKQYNKATADVDLGIPLRLTSDFNKPSNRSTVQQTYSRIIQDLQDALLLLPEEPAFKTRPSKPAAYGLLARVYLQMGDYNNAFASANAYLQAKSTLLDFNYLNGSAKAPVPIFNAEVIFYTANTSSITWASYINIDSVLYQSYDENDLRKKIYFQDHGNGTAHFKGSYNGTVNNLFQGVATDEMFLIRAECYARSGNITEAMKDLNTLLVSRWRTNQYVPLIAESADEALEIILRERKKELVSRGIRWSDIRRLNMEPRFATTLKRIIDGVVYSLPPNDPRFTLLIPTEVINLSGIQQNER